MQPVNRFGLVVVALSALTVLLVFGTIVGIRALLDSRLSEEDTPVAGTTTPEQLVAATDSDNDGLADEIEPIYRTDPNNPDTDGDATNDGDELLQLRDPITPGPDDTLESITAEGEIDTSTFTGRYLATLPADASQADVLSSTRLEAFIEEERQALIPSAFTPTVQQTNDEGAAAIETYLAAIASSHNEEIAAVTSQDISNAFTAYLTQRDRSGLDDIVEKLTSNLSLLEDVEAPTEAADLHRDLLAASQSLLENTKLLQSMKEDFVGGLVGAKNIEALGPTFTDIASQIAALEEKYGLE